MTEKNFFLKFEVRCSDMLASMLTHELKDFRINSVHPVPKEPGKDVKRKKKKELIFFLFLLFSTHRKNLLKI